MTTWSAEQIVDAAISTLSLGLAASLDAVYTAQAQADADAGRAVAYTAPRPGSTDATPEGDYYPGGATTFLRYPAVEVALPDLRLEAFSLGLADADSTETLVVCAWEQSARRDLLFRKLTRLGAACFDTLAQPGALLGAQVEQVEARWRFNPQTNERDEITSAALLVFRLSSVRARP